MVRSIGLVALLSLLSTAALVISAIALTFGAAFLVLRPFKRFFGSREVMDDVLGGFLLGWAIVTRASEALWLIPAGLAFARSLRDTGLEVLLVERQPRRDGAAAGW